MSLKRVTTVRTGHPDGGGGPGKGESKNSVDLCGVWNGFVARRADADDGVCSGCAGSECGRGGTIIIMLTLALTPASTSLPFLTHLA